MQECRPDECVECVTGIELRSSDAACSRPREHEKYVQKAVVLWTRVLDPQAQVRDNTTHTRVQDVGDKQTTLWVCPSAQKGHAAETTEPWRGRRCFRSEWICLLVVGGGDERMGDSAAPEAVCV
jgi:hypothetical protein